MSSSELVEHCRNRLQTVASQIAPAAPVHVSVALEAVVRRALMTEFHEMPREWLLEMPDFWASEAFGRSSGCSRSREEPSGRLRGLERS